MRVFVEGIHAQFQRYNGIDTCCYIIVLGNVLMDGKRNVFFTVAKLNKTIIFKTSVLYLTKIFFIADTHIVKRHMTQKNNVQSIPH